MARSQRIVPIKLSHSQIDVLAKIVEYGEFNGRSPAIRELVVPALNAGVTAMNSESYWKAMKTWIEEMENLSGRMKLIAVNCKKGKQEDFDMDLNLPPIEVQPV